MKKSKKKTKKKTEIIIFKAAKYRCILHGNVNAIKSKKVSNDQETGAIRTIVSLSKPKFEINKNKNRRNTERLYGKPNEQLFPKRKPATQLHKSYQISSRHMEDENSTETDT